MNKQTQDQIAAVMLLHGTTEQQRAAIEYCGMKSSFIHDSLKNTNDSDPEFSKTVDDHFRELF